MHCHYVTVIYKSRYFAFAVFKVAFRGKLTDSKLRGLDKDGPRWASWNLGVFMCIRCAGIHRNLGVHISRVKSVNLDQWTPEQIQSMVDMGNNRAKQLYEAHLPENFRRPQTDQAVEVFIRDKYERKKYFNKEALDAAPADRSRQEKEREKKKDEKKKEKDVDKVERHNNTKTKHGSSSLSVLSEAVESIRDELTADFAPTQTFSVTDQSECTASPKKGTEAAVDLLGLDAPAGGGKDTGGAAPINDELDIFGPMVSNPLPSSNNTQQAQAGCNTGSLQRLCSFSANGANAAGVSGDHRWWKKSGSSTAALQSDPATSSSSSSSTSTTTTTRAEEKKLLSKDSILSLYASSSVGSQPQSQQQPAPGQAGMYMGQPQMQFPQQGFTPGMGGAIPPNAMMGGGTMVSGVALPNGGYMGMQQGAMPASQGQNMYNMQQGQWNMNQDVNMQMKSSELADKHGSSQVKESDAAAYQCSL
ncbi:hypothetical protein PAMP_001178 [Pampus punctatissimus]